MPFRPVRIGTRGSPMALYQAGFVRDRLRAVHPELAADGAVELAIIRTTAEIMRSKERTEAEYITALDLILAESERTTELLEDLLLLARADAQVERVALYSRRAPLDDELRLRDRKRLQKELIAMLKRKEALGKLVPWAVAWDQNRDPAFEAMRKPIALTPDKMKRKSGTEQVIPTQARNTPGAPQAALNVPPSGPVRLTKRKSGKHETLPLGVLPPSDDEK